MFFCQQTYFNLYDTARAMNSVRRVSKVQFISRENMKLKSEVERTRKIWIIFYGGRYLKYSVRKQRGGKKPCLQYIYIRAIVST